MDDYFSELALYHSSYTNPDSHYVYDLSLEIRNDLTVAAEESEAIQSSKPLSIKSSIV